MYDIQALARSIPIQRLDIPLFAGFTQPIYLIRLDKIQLTSSGRLAGNKVFKLLPTLVQVKAQTAKGQVPQMISFGGAWSNHLHALAAAGQHYGIATVGIVRGERKPVLTPTLRDCIAMGMRLQFVSRGHYRRLQQADALACLQQQFGFATVIPVGGSNLGGLQGARAMGQVLATRLPADVADIWLAAATGGTAAGLIAGVSSAKQPVYTGQVTAVNVLRHCDMAHDIGGFLRQLDAMGRNKMCEKGTASQAWRVMDGYHCGGYARVNKALLAFHQQLESELGESVDQVYMAKLFFALWSHLGSQPSAKRSSQAATAGNAKPSAIAIIHSGGQQGRRPQ